MLKVVLIEDSLDVQQALRGLLSTLPGVQILGAADDTAGAQRLIDMTRPDVVVLDVALHGKDRGMDVLRHVRTKHPDTDVVVLSNFGWQAMREGFLLAGAVAYFDKGLQFREACEWIRRQAAGA